MRRLFFCAALVGALGGLTGCDDKKTVAASSGTGTGPRTGAGPVAPPPPPPPPLPPK
jgi:hypothetical protein